MADGILAAYLLAVDEFQEEIKSIEFAEGDENRAEKAGPIDLRFDVPPQEAIDYFRRKRIVTQKTFNKLDREAKAAAFYVSGVYREDVLTAFKDEITDALEDGQTSKYVAKQFKEILDGAGHQELGDWHLETVVRSNMMSAYGVGRRKAMEDSADLLPFWEYSAVNDDRTRPTHRALDGVIYPAKHEFWDTHFPPWGFNCRCTVIARLDVPDDYDHSRPNPDTTIAYDKDGLPAKAEYLTQVVDLKTTKFVGVPKIANLEKALIDAAKAAKDARLLNHQNLPQVIVDKAKQWRLEKRENLTGWNKDGENIGEFVGTEESVAYPRAIRPQLKDGFDIHNHGREQGHYFESFSPGDYEDISLLDLKASYLITQNYLYQMRRGKNGWKSYTEFLASYRKHRAIIANKLNREPYTSTYNLKQIEDLERHLIFKAVAKELNFKYKRFRVSEL